MPGNEKVCDGTTLLFFSSLPAHEDNEFLDIEMKMYDYHILNLPTMKT